MTEIKITNISYKGCNVISGLPDFIGLHPRFLEFKWNVEAEKEDDRITMPRKYQGQKAFLKKDILGVEAYWSNSQERYCCNLLLSSEADTSCWMFETFAEAVAVKDKILAWLLTE